MTRASRYVARVSLSLFASACSAAAPPPGAHYVRAQPAPDPPPPPAPVVVRTPQPAPRVPASAQLKPMPGHSPAPLATKPKGLSPAARVRRQPQGVGRARQERLLQRDRPVLLRARHPLPGLRGADAHHGHRPRARGEDSRGTGLGRRRAVAACPRQVDGGGRRAAARVLEAHPARARDQPRHQYRPAQLPARASQLRRHVHGGHRLALPRRRTRAAASAGLGASRPREELRPGRGDRRAQLRLHDPGGQGRARVDAGAGVRRRPAHVRSLSLRHGAARSAALFVLRDSETQLVNYRVKNDTYVIDRLIDAAEPAGRGQKDQEIVRIARAGTEPARPPAHTGKR